MLSLKRESFLNSGTIVMYCKGAETAILEKTIDGPTEVTLSHINSYAEVCVLHFKSNSCDGQD